MQNRLLCRPGLYAERPDFDWSQRCALNCANVRDIVWLRSRAIALRSKKVDTVRKAEVIGSRVIALRSKKVDTVRKAEVIGSVHDDVCTHRSRATVQNRLAQKPGFYAESACTRQARWIFRLLSATGLYVSSASTRDFTVGAYKQLYSPCRFRD